MRNAICMACGRIGSWDERAPFEKIATDYEYTITGSAEKAYKKIVDKLTTHLVDAAVLGVVEWKQIERNKKTPPLPTGTKLYNGLPTATLNGEKSALILLPQQQRA